MLKLLGIDVPEDIANGALLICAVLLFLMVAVFLSALKNQTQYKRQEKVWKESHRAARRQQRRFERGQARLTERFERQDVINTRDRIQREKEVRQLNEATRHNRTIFQRFIDSREDW
jgi:uncharacterized membrane protein YhiD involved in acid resistance